VAVRLRPILVASLLALLATACIKVDYDITVEDDGSGSLEGILAIDVDSFAGMGEMFGEEAQDTDALCDEFRTGTGLPPNLEVSEYEEDGFCGVRFSGSWAAGDDPAAQIGALLAGDTEEGGTDGQVTLVEDAAGGWRFEAPFDSEGLTAEAGAGDLEDMGGMADQFLGDASFRFAITLPGRPVEGQNNATSVDGNTFEWDIDFTAPPDRFFAQTEPGSPGGGGDGFPWVIVVGLVAGAVIIAAVVLLVRRGAKTMTDPMPPGGGAPPSAGAAAPAAPQPVWDAARNTWVVQDPVRGWMRHDPATGQWVPLD
jgi:hypothetical protein